MLVFAIVTLFGVVQSRAVNISNTWMLPEEGFPVFYRYFRDRISWYEADAVCQFHHANLVTADSSSQYDAIRAYLKELDITAKVWIGLSKPQDKPSYLWTDFRPLSGGHWQEALPASDTQSLCAVMDPAADFLWKALPCGGPEVAAFICEMPIPSWALGSRGCLLTELPSLTVLYIPEQSALELTSDCGLDGTKRIACKGNADHEEMLKQLTCVMAHEDIDDDKTAKTSMTDYFESSTWADTDDDGKVTKNWSSNTINPEQLTPTRHRRETEDTLSPLSTKSSFQENSEANVSWQEQHQEKAVLTTQHVLLDLHVTPTPATNLNLDKLSSETPSSARDFGNSKLMHTSEKIMSTEQDKELAANVKSTQTLPTEKFPTTQRAVEFGNSSPKPTADLKTDSVSVSPRSIATEGTSTTTTQEGNVEDYPSAISQGQLFSIIENGTMFDIIELNETAQQSINKITLSDATTENVQTTTDQPTNANVSPKLPVPTKKSTTKKPVQPTKKVYKKDFIVKHLPEASTTKRIQSVDEMEEKLTKEFEMMPDVKDTSVRLNRTFRKELPVVSDEDTEHANLENGSQYGVPRILNFTVVNAVDFDNDEGFQHDQPQQDDKNITGTVVIGLSNKDETVVEEKVAPTGIKEPLVATGISTAAINSTENNSNYRVVETTVTDFEKVVIKKPLVTESLPEDNNEISKKVTVTNVPEHNPIDPRLYIANHQTVIHPSNHTESVATHNNEVTTEKSKLAKEDFLPKSLLGEKPLESETPTTDATAPYSQTSDGYSEHPFPSDEPKKINRHRSLHNNKGRKFYPYFFSRMLG